MKLPKRPRVIGSGAPTRYLVEFTVGPYLYFASQIYSSLDGMATRANPPAAADTPYEAKAEFLPRTLSEALHCIATQAEKPNVKKLVEDVEQQVSAGGDLSSALARHPRSFPQLYISLNTLKTHVREIYRKLNVTSRSEAVARARELGLL